MTVTASEAAPITSRLGWDDWGLGLAEAASKRADCRRRQVGAVITDSEHTIVGVGYNGYPAGKPGCLTEDGCPRGQLTYAQVPAGSAYVGVAAVCSALHAEEQAVMRLARAHGARYTMYVNHEPCPNCSRLLGGVPGLIRVVWPAGELAVERPLR